MKVYISLVIILLMASVCWCSSCRWANWWNSFDRADWSRCRSNEYVKGFYRNSWTPSDPISLLEEARCCTAPASYYNTAPTCVEQPWTELDGTEQWAKCPHGYFVRGLRRSGGNGVSNIEKAECCKPNTLTYGHCYTDSRVWLNFDKKGSSLCRDGYYLVGIYKGTCNHLYCIEMFYCCQMAVEDRYQKR